MFAAMVRAELKFFEEAENDVTFLCERLARDVDTLQHVSKIQVDQKKILLVKLAVLRRCFSPSWE